jgi:hypothetical protein
MGIDAKAFLNESNTSGIDFFIANRKQIMKHIIDWQVMEEDLIEEKKEAKKELKKISSIQILNLNRREKIEVESKKKHLREILRKEGPEIHLETPQMAFAWDHRKRLLQILESQEAIREKLRGPVESVAGLILTPVRWISDSLANRFEVFEDISKELRRLPATLVDWL